MGCCGGVPGDDGQGNSQIIIAYAGPECLTSLSSKCPLDGSGIKHIRRPKAHWKCRANGHAWRIC